MGDPLGPGISATSTPLAVVPIPDRAALQVDLSLYSEAVVLRAAYKFTDRCFVFLARAEAEAALVVALSPRVPGDDLARLVGAFANELLDQRLREDLEGQFGDLRRLIVAQAFSEGNLLTPGDDEADYRKDPQGAGRRR